MGLNIVESHIFLQLFVGEWISSKISKENIILINFGSINPKNIRCQDELYEFVLDLINNIQCHIISIWMKCKMLNFGKKSLCCTIRFGLELIWFGLFNWCLIKKVKINIKKYWFKNSFI